MLEQLLRSYVRVLTSPSVTTFEEEKPRASLGAAVVGWLLGGLVSGVLSALGVLVGVSLQIPLAGQGDREGLAVLGIGAGVLAVLTLVLTPLASVLGGLIGNAWLLLWARVLGGRGSYTEQTYLLSLASVPLGVISSAAGLIPCFGFLVSMAVAVYGLVLGVLGVMSAHQVSAGRAVGILALAIGVVLAIFCVIGVAIAVFVAVLAAAAG